MQITELITILFGYRIYNALCALLGGRAISEEWNIKSKSVPGIISWLYKILTFIYNKFCNYSCGRTRSVETCVQRKGFLFIFQTHSHSIREYTSRPSHVPMYTHFKSDFMPEKLALLIFCYLICPFFRLSLAFNYKY